MSSSPDQDELLARAIEIAVQAHKGQKDKSGKPYILHPLRVMMRMTTTEQMMVAVLHDVVEDTEWTLDDLRKEGFSEAVVQGVDCLSRRDGETYDEFFERLRPHALARRVKLGDLEDNMDVRRLVGNVTEKDVERLDKYLKYWRKLTQE